MKKIALLIIALFSLVMATEMTIPTKNLGSTFTYQELNQIREALMTKKRTIHPEAIELTGNVTANKFIGNGSGLTSVSANTSLTANTALNALFLGGKAEGTLSVSTASYSDNSGLIGGKAEAELNVSTAVYANNSDKLDGQHGDYYMEASRPVGILTDNADIRYLGIAATANNAITSSYSNDSDKLDGQHGSYYQNASNINAGNLNPAYLPMVAVTNNYTGNLSLGGSVSVSATTPVLYLRETDQGTDGKIWQFTSSGGTLYGSAVNDANSGTREFLAVARSGLDITSQIYGNSSNNPSHVFYGNVGVGTSTPITKLEVDGAVTVTGGALVVSNAPTYAQRIKKGATFSDITQKADGNLEVYAFNGVSSYKNILLGVDGNTTAGNVGVGLVTPNARLSVKAIGNGYANSSALTLEDSDSTTKTYLTHINGDFFVSNDGTNDHFVIKSNGNTGIGTTAPTNKLDISGGSIGIDNNRGLRWKNSGGIYTDTIYADGNDDLNLSGFNVKVNNSTASTLPTNGSLTTAGGLGVGGSLNVAGTVSANQILLSAPSGAKATIADPENIVTVNNQQEIIVTFSTEVYDRLGEYNTSTGKFTPNESGTYVVQVKLQMSTDGAIGSGWHSLSVFDGVDPWPASSYQPTLGAIANRYVNCSVSFRATKGVPFYLYYGNYTGGAIQIVAGSMRIEKVN